MRVIERARVVEVKDGTARLAILLPEDPERCGRCPAAGACGRGARTLTARAPAQAGVRPGDEVKVAIETVSPVTAAFLIFVLPMAAAFAAGIAVYLAGAGEVLALVAGFAGAGAAYLALYLFGAGSNARVEILVDGK